MILVEDTLFKKEENQILVSENAKLTKQVAVLEQDLADEKSKSSELTRQVEDQLKQIRMLNKGIKDLEEVLMAGGTSNVNLGLNNHVGTSQGGRQPSQQNRRLYDVNGEMAKQRPEFTYSKSRATGCWYCGKPGHFKASCYRFLSRVKQVIQQKRFYRNDKQTNQETRLVLQHGILN